MGARESVSVTPKWHRKVFAGAIPQMVRNGRFDRLVVVGRAFLGGESVVVVGRLIDWREG